MKKIVRLPTYLSDSFHCLLSKNLTRSSSAQRQTGIALGCIRGRTLRFVTDHVTSRMRTMRSKEEDSAYGTGPLEEDGNQN